MNQTLKNEKSLTNFVEQRKKMKKNAVLLKDRTCEKSPDQPLQECSEWWEHGKYRVSKEQEEWQEQILLGAE